RTGSVAQARPAGDRARAGTLGVASARRTRPCALERYTAVGALVARIRRAPRRVLATEPPGLRAGADRTAVRGGGGPVAVEIHPLVAVVPAIELSRAGGERLGIRRGAGAVGAALCPGDAHQHVVEEHPAARPRTAAGERAVEGRRHHLPVGLVQL